MYWLRAYANANGFEDRIATSATHRVKRTVRRVGVRVWITTCGRQVPDEEDTQNEVYYGQATITCITCRQLESPSNEVKER